MSPLVHCWRWLGHSVGGVVWPFSTLESNLVPSKSGRGVRPTQIRHLWLNQSIHGHDTHFPDSRDSNNRKNRGWERTNFPPRYSELRQLSLNQCGGVNPPKPPPTKVRTGASSRALTDKHSVLTLFLGLAKRTNMLVGQLLPVGIYQRVCPGIALYLVNKHIPAIWASFLCQWYSALGRVIFS